MPKRVELIAAIGFQYTKTRTISEVLLTSDTLLSLRELDKAVKQQGGQLRINSVFRTWTKQQELFDLHEKDPKKYPVASAPGKSFHQAGRSIDFDVQHLNFVNVPKENWLRKFWDLCKPLGFSPIIDKPDLSMSESWHEDHMGVWKSVKDKLGYLIAAQCAVFDCGNWDPNVPPEVIKQTFIQCQLLRLGHFEIGKLDGVIGPKTKSVLSGLGIKDRDLGLIIEKIKKL